jgi:hypothetical protein
MHNAFDNAQHNTHKLRFTFTFMTASGCASCLPLVGLEMASKEAASTMYTRVDAPHRKQYTRCIRLRLLPADGKAVRQQAHNPC